MMGPKFLVHIKASISGNPSIASGNGNNSGSEVAMPPTLLSN